MRVSCDTNCSLQKEDMRLRSINVYSEYLGDTEKTRERTRQLRVDSDFMDYIFAKNIKYIDNEYIKQYSIDSLLDYLLSPQYSY